MSNTSKPATPASAPKYPAGHRITSPHGQDVVVASRDNQRIELTVRRSSRDAPAIAFLDLEEARAIGQALLDLADELERPK